MQNLQFTVLKSARIDVGANGAKERDFYRNWIRTKLDFCEAITLWDCLPLDTFSGLKGLKRLTLDSCRFLRRLPEILEKGLPNENPGFTIQFSTYFDTQMVGEMFENDERGVIEEDELRFQHLYEPFKRSTFQGFHSCSSYRKWLDDGKYLAFFGALVSDDPVNERPPGSVFLAKLLESGDKSEK
ncbi:unnamed protein product, partial [Mesorhabditis belari]|uniref:Uncharacterized protein n=1 Tax=Mesorhabditis belari TaxID=2138241 RepID=A0AAF3F4M6_9BILA